ncbi:MAG TPA: TonB-dependent receptor [Opitutaceae bacterium]|nr:TonB-dependent receptor [Opitutaceae bacterium]
MRFIPYVRATACALLLPLTGASLAMAAPAKTVVFKVKAQPMGIALMSLALQGEVEVLFPYEEIKQLPAPEITGRMTTEQALAAILKGTPYTFHRHPDRARSYRIMSPEMISVAKAEEVRTGVPAFAKEVPPPPAPVLTVGDASILPERKTDDVVPSVVFKGSTVEQAGALTAGDFLAEQLPASSGPSLSGDVGLRGLGDRYTQVLINGREDIDLSTYSNVETGMNYKTSKLSMIPLSSIQRIEVIPQSASAYVGGGAAAGAINVVTKRDYTGGEITVGYDNSFDTDSANRKAELRYGTHFNGGRTRLMVFAATSTSNSLAVQDRYSYFRDYSARLTTLTAGLPEDNLLFGATPRVETADGTPLVLKSGQVLNGSFVYLPTGYRGVELDGTDSLVQNAGKASALLPANVADYQGRRLLLNRRPNIDSLRAEFRHGLTSNVEFFVDASYEKSFRREITYLYSSDAYVTVPVGVPNNPFGQQVRVRFPSLTLAPHESSRWHHGITTGFVVDLPRDWTARVEHGRTYNRSIDHAETATYANLNEAVNSGELNVFQDSPQLSELFSGYASSRMGRGAIHSVDSRARAEGALPEFFDIQPTLSFGGQWRKVTRRQFEVFDSGLDTISGVLPAAHSFSGIHAELKIPLFDEGRTRPGIRLLELVAAGRHEKHTLRSSVVKSTGSANVPSLAARPETVTSRFHYVSDNPLIGLRYKPLNDLTLRTSYSTSYLPVADYHLLPQFAAAGAVSDPQRGNTAAQPTVTTGGNTNLKPESADTVSAGVVYSPASLPGFRVSLDYTNTKKDDAVDLLSPQTILKYEQLLPGRVTRGDVPAGDSYTVGPITQIDATALNLYSAKLAAWDLAVAYRKEFPRVGTFDLSALYTLQSKFEQQLAPFSPLVDLVNEPLYAGPLRDRSTVAVVWSHGNFGAGWSARFHGRYKTTPSSETTATLEPTGLGLSARVYHDAFIRYRLPAINHRLGSWLGGTEFLGGVKNIFDEAPLFDATVPTGQLLNGGGDLRGASYYFSVKREF